MRERWGRRALTFSALFGRKSRQAPILPSLTVQSLHIVVELSRTSSRSLWLSLSPTVSVNTYTVRMTTCTPSKRFPLAFLRINQLNHTPPSSPFRYHPILPHRPKCPTTSSPSSPATTPATWSWLFPRDLVSPESPPTSSTSTRPSTLPSPTPRCVPLPSKGVKGGTAQGMAC